MSAIMFQFIKTLKKKEHIRPLLKGLDMLVTIATDDKKYHLVFHNGNVTLQEVSNETQTKIIISGSTEAIDLLLMGRERLRVLEKIGSLQVKSSLRNALLLESIFYLTKPDVHLAKII
ncbi:hypothetical protein [Bacillus rubiinfantis]|uniref:hypothetical protein n=1 Tax=Bacillus rubiinfantis TaxID=1499680 RepID=UPI0005A95CFF|nr:hypothetical protein [Bacillus rubiinfantis]